MFLPFCTFPMYWAVCFLIKFLCYLSKKNMVINVSECEMTNLCAFLWLHLIGNAELI